MLQDLQQFQAALDYPGDLVYLLVLLGQCLHDCQGYQLLLHLRLVLVVLENLEPLLVLVDLRPQQNQVVPRILAVLVVRVNQRVLVAQLVQVVQHPLADPWSLLVHLIQQDPVDQVLQQAQLVQWLLCYQVILKDLVAQQVLQVQVLLEPQVNHSVPRLLADQMLQLLH